MLAKEINTYDPQPRSLAHLEQLAKEISEFEELAGSEEIIRKERQLIELVGMIHELMGEERYNQLIQKNM